MPEKVYLKKDILIDTLEKKLELHKKVYTECMIAFKKNYVNALKQMIKDSKKNKFSQYIEAEKPQNHTEDYENAIKMIKMSCRNEVELTDTEFKQYILNKWAWMSEFKRIYISNSSSSSSSFSSSSFSANAKAYFGE